MKELCGIDCCGKCGMLGNGCEGCEITDGHPCGGSCTAAECVKNGGTAALMAQKEAIIREINALQIEGLQINDLNLLSGAYINLEYVLENGCSVKLLKDNRIYWANQAEIPGSTRCYGIAADERQLLICSYGCGGSDPEIVLYKKRK